MNATRPGGTVVVGRRRMSEVEYIPDEYCWVQLEDSNMSQEISRTMVGLGLKLVAGRRV